MKHPCRFAAAAEDEQTVYGACRPGYPSNNPDNETVEQWLSFIQQQGVDRVCCLLDTQLNHYPALLDRYSSVFEEDHVCHAPIPDYNVVSADIFHDVIFPFLQEADRSDSRVVVHCSAGQGRTGHVLALWLVHGRGYNLKSSVQAVQRTGRKPLEAATIDELANICERPRGE